MKAKAPKAKKSQGKDPKVTAKDLRKLPDKTLGKVKGGAIYMSPKK